MNPEDQICRLCLKVTKNGFQEIDDTMEQLLNILCLNLVLDITKRLIICQDCIQTAKKCLDFKLMYVDTEQIILSFSAGGKISKRRLQFIYAKKEHVVIVNDEDLVICRFCMTRLGENNFVSSNASMDKTMLEILAKYMPEMDFNLTDDPLICTTCRKNMEDYFQFIQIYLDTEKKINSYCQEERSDVGILNLGNVLSFLFKSPLESPVKCHKLHEINKSEPSEFNDAENVYQAQSGLIKQEELDIKDEGINLKEKAETFKCFLCAHEAKHKSNLARHMIVHKDVSDLEMFKCSFCPYETKRKSSLKIHMIVHKDVSELKMSKCSLCPFETKRKSYLKKHMLVHKDVSELKMFKCTSCAFETKHKGSLKKHNMSAHNDVFELNIFKSSFCAHETKEKADLKTHMLVHKDISELKIFKCSFCAYETKHKCYFKKHMTVHNAVSELEMFKCSLCSFETGRESSLKMHMLLVHKDVSEYKLF